MSDSVAQNAPYQVMPPPSDEDYAALEASIIADGICKPVEYDDHGNILDGHTRVQIAQSLGLAEWPKIIKTGLSEAEKRAYARTVNVARRHLTQKQKRAMIDDQLRDQPSLADRAIAAMLSVSDKTVAARRKALVDGAEIPHHDEREGKDGVRQPVKRVRSHYVPVPDDQKAYLDGAKAIRTAKRGQRRATRLDLLREIAKSAPEGEAGQLPRSKFPVIYCDPPWKNHVRSEETGNDRAYPYPVMGDDDVIQLCAGNASPALADAVLFLWVTANRVHLGLRVLQAWGFEYKSQMIWDKMVAGTGRWVRDRHEVLMIATRGNIPAPIPGTQCESIIVEKKGEHSVKPVGFAEMIQRFYPGVPKLEMFQRASSLAEGDVRLNGEWKFWGFESGEAADGGI